MRWPEGPGLRTDRAIESGSVVSPAYDSLVAKVMAHGEDRDTAIARLSLALRGLELDGLETNRELLGAVLDDEAFVDGAVDVHFLERRPDLRDAWLPDDVRRRHAAAAASASPTSGPPAASSRCPPRVGATSAAPSTPTSSRTSRDDRGPCRGAGRARTGPRRRCLV